MNISTKIAQLLSLSILMVGVVSCTSNETTVSEPTTLNTSSQPGVEQIDYYQEEHRPQVHYSPAEGWMNDPNGLIFMNGQYHMYYQFNPDTTVWGPMHWGHATSQNLLGWAHQPIALAPDELGTIFSGSMVLDKDNTSGFGKDGIAPLVAIFTHHDAAGEANGENDFQRQSLAFSLDGGYTFEKFAGNPVLENPGLKDFRDPKVIWHEESQRWIMALAVKDRIKFYRSPDLKSWEYTSEVGPNIGSQGGIWECPDLFPLRNTLNGEQKYVLLISVQDGAPNGGTGTSYMIGNFDGMTFTPEVGHDSPLWLDYGTDNYAFVTFSNGPFEETRRLGIGWMSNWQYAQKVPSQKWRSAMTSARFLSLITLSEGMRLKSELVPDLYNLRGERARINRLSDMIPTDLTRSFGAWLAGPMEINLNTPGGQVPEFSFEVISTLGDTVSFGYDAKSSSYFIDRSKLTNADFSEAFKARHTVLRKESVKSQTIRILLDRSSIEMFADDGFTVMTDSYFLEGDVAAIKLDGAANITGTIYQLNPELPTPESVARVRLGLDK